jgi:PknH-like extracellular domain
MPYAKGRLGLRLQPTSGEGQFTMRQLTTVFAVAATGILVAGCGGGSGGGSASSSAAKPTTSPSKPPLAQSALAGLILPGADVDAAMGVTGTKIMDTADTLTEDKSASIFSAGYKLPGECLYAAGAGLVPVYAGSGNTAVHRERDVLSLPPDSNDRDPQVNQVVVLFPSAKEANAFFEASAKAWPACADRQDTAPGDANNFEIHWVVGPVSAANRTLSTTVTATATKDGNSMSASCQRALTVRNNVVIDVEACLKDPGDVAVKIAGQIAAKVEKP